MLAKFILQCVQGLWRAEPFDRRDLRPVDLDRESEAGARAVAIQKHRAGTADAVLATDMSAGQTERVAEEVRQQQARLDIIDVVPGTIHGHCESGHYASSLCRQRCCDRSLRKPIQQMPAVFG